MIQRLVIFVFFCMAVVVVHAQTSTPITSTNGLFTFPESIVCVSYGSSDEIIITTSTGDCPATDPTKACVIDFNYNGPGTFGKKPDPDNPGSFILDDEDIRLFHDGEPLSVANEGKTYSFTQPGSYNIAIIVGTSSSGISKSDELPQNVTVLPNTPPTFDIYNCQNNEVQVDITDLTFPLYTVDYDNDGITDDDQVPPGQVSHTYPVTETQAIITVRPDYQGCTQNTKAIQLHLGNFTNSQLIARLEVTDANAIDLGFQNTDNTIPYLLERSANAVGPFSQVDQIFGVSAFSDNPANPDQNFYCYRLTVQDVCSGQTFPPSNVICSHATNLNLQDGSNTIDWTTNLSGAGALTLFRNDVVMNPGPPFNNTGTITDNAVICGTEYCYRFITDYGTSIQSISKTLCGEAFSTQPPLPINEVATTVEGNSVRLDWVTNENYTITKYNVFRIPTNVALPYAETPELTLTDNTYRPFEGICYEISFEDVCENRSSRSQRVCPIELKATLNDKDNSVALEWNAYVGWSGGVDHYTLEKYDENGQLIESLDLTTPGYTDLKSSPGQTFSYRIIATPVAPLVPQPSVSNITTIIKSPMLYHPTAFIPGSAISGNETFSVKGVPEYLSSYELRIFNRWGEMMFHSTDMDQAWDGTFKGVTMPEGTYIFKTKVVDTAGRTFDYSGSVVLLRR